MNVSITVEGGQPFTYDLFDALRPSEFERRGSWFAESSEPPNCCWASGITPQFRRDSIRRDLPSISIIPENLFPSISARHDVVDGTGKLNPRGRDTLLCNHAK